MITPFQQRLSAFVQLGRAMRHLAESDQWPGFSCALTETEFSQLRSLFLDVKNRNGWFTEEAVAQAFRSWADALSEDSLAEWIAPYRGKIESVRPVTVAVICAGNIPIVGFHDILSILITGHKALIKLSSDDDVLIPALLHLLCRIEPAMESQIAYPTGKLEDFGAVIATGSNNTARYFHQYFSSYPHIIRKGRHSVAVLSGEETNEELNGLGHDIFDFYGLGCRSVSKIYVPRGYDLNHFFGGIFSFKEVVNHNKYANNYDYNKAVWLLNREELMENGFLILKEDLRIPSPTASLFYEYYDDLSSLYAQLDQVADSLQCIVSRDKIPFGKSQCPGLSDYADGVDTMAFLNGLLEN